MTRHSAFPEGREIARAEARGSEMQKPQLSLKQQAVRGALWSAIQNWGSILITGLVFVVLARLLKPTDFGLVTYATVFTSFLSIFQRQGFAQAIVQRADLNPGHLDTAFWMSSGCGLVLAVGLFFSAGSIAKILAEQPLGPVLRWLSVVILIDAVGNTPQAILRRHMAFKSLALRTLGGALLGGGVGVGMAIAGFGVWSLVGQQIAAAVAGTVALWAASGWLPRWSASSTHFRELFGFGAFIMGRELVHFFSRQSDFLLIGMFAGAAPLGYYRIGRQLLLMMHRLFTQTFSGVALPIFSRVQDNHAQLREALLTATRMASLVAFPAFLGMCVLAPELVIALFGARWEPSIPVMRFFALVGLIQSVMFFNGPMIVARGKPAWAFALTLANSLASVALYVLAVPWGIVAVAVAHLVRSCIYAPFPLWCVQRLIALDMGTYFRGFLAPLVGAVVMMVVIVGARVILQPLVNLYVFVVLSVVLGLAVFALVMQLLAPQRMAQAGEFLRLALLPEKV